MNKPYCDKCESAIDYTGGKIERWDGTFGDRLNGIIWSVEARGNFMNSKVDVCKACRAEGLKILLRGAIGMGLMALEDIR